MFFREIRLLSVRGQLFLCLIHPCEITCKSAKNGVKCSKKCEKIRKNTLFLHGWET